MLYLICSIQTRNSGLEQPQFISKLGLELFPSVSELHSSVVCFIFELCSSKTLRLSK